ncbi:MAG: ATP-binding protein [Myxococcota bacterium]
MTDARPEGSGIDIALGDIARLEDVVDREALRDVCKSFFELFSLSVRVFSAGGTLLADVHDDQPIHEYLREFPRGRQALSQTVDVVAKTFPRAGEVHRQTEITGAVYDIVPLSYQGRPVGRLVIGPYLPAELKEVPRALLKLDDNLDRQRVRDCLTKMPRVRQDTAERIIGHLSGIIDLLLFSSHRAHLTSEMHVASVRESYRELAEKTAKLQTAYDRLKELDRLKNNFLATVSHELRTPLTSIIGYSEMLESGIAGDLNEEQREFVDTIHAKGDQLLALISSLLDLSKLEQGVMRIEPQPLDAAAIVEDIAKTFTPAARKKNIEVVTKVDAELPTIDGDPIRIKQVLSNLAENAVKFTPEGGQVFFEAHATDFDDAGDDAMGAIFFSGTRRAVAFLVRDTGIGMPPAELPKIFDAFYQVDGSSTREHGGTGLGLSIVKRLVDAHGGRIDVSSDIGAGTTFTIVIPEPDS